MVVRGFEQAAGTYFVANERAAERTRRHPNIAPVVVGSLRHAAYSALSPIALRASGRARLPQPTAATIVAFYGQPAWRLSGYARSIARFAAALGTTMPETPVLYRPHPKESPAERQATVAMFSARGVTTLLDPNPDIETSLCVPDVIVSCYSLCNIDSIYVQRHSPAPLGVGLYLLFEPDVATVFADESGGALPWPVQQQIACCVTREHDVEKLLRECAAPGAARTVWSRIQRQVQPVEDAAGAVIERILDDLHLAGHRS
jgi:hypothetical protein